MWVKYQFLNFAFKYFREANIFKSHCAGFIWIIWIEAGVDQLWKCKSSCLSFISFYDFMSNLEFDFIHLLTWLSQWRKWWWEQTRTCSWRWWPSSCPGKTWTNRERSETQMGGQVDGWTVGGVYLPSVKSGTALSRSRLRTSQICPSSPSSSLLSPARIWTVDWSSSSNTCNCSDAPRRSKKSSERSGNTINEVMCYDACDGQVFRHGEEPGQSSTWILNHFFNYPILL